MQTQEFVTKLGNKIVLRSTLSYNDLLPSVGIEDPIKRSEKIVELAIISLNDVTDKAYELIKALPFFEYKAISDEVIKMLTGNFTPAK